MKKVLVVISVALMSLSFSTAALAKSQTGPIAREKPGVTMAMKPLVRSYRLIGQVVKGADNENLGRITQILLDPDSGQAVYVIVTSGGVLNIGSQRRLVPWQALHIQLQNYAVSIELTARQFSLAPRGTVVNSRQQAEKIHRYYGVAPHCP